MKSPGQKLERELPASTRVPKNWAGTSSVGAEGENGLSLHEYHRIFGAMQPPPYVCTRVACTTEHGSPSSFQRRRLAEIEARGRKLGRPRSGHRPVQLWAGNPKTAMQARAKTRRDVSRTGEPSRYRRTLTNSLRILSAKNLAIFW